MEKRIGQIESNLSALSQDFNSLKEAISSGFTKVENNFESVKKELTHLNGRIEHISKQVESLKGSTDGGFEEVGIKLDTLTDEISKIGKVTKYNEEWKNLQELKN